MFNVLFSFQRAYFFFFLKTHSKWYWIWTYESDLVLYLFRMKPSINGVKSFTDGSRFVIGEMFTQATPLENLVRVQFLMSIRNSNKLFYLICSFNVVHRLKVLRVRNFYSYLCCVCTGTARLLSLLVIFLPYSLTAWNGCGWDERLREPK